MENEGRVAQEYQDICCLNCGFDFQSENQEEMRFSFCRTDTLSSSLNIDDVDLDDTEIQILEGIHYIFGISLRDFEFLQGNLSKENAALCSACSHIFSKVYNSLVHLQKLSNGNSLLWKCVKWKRVSVKSELNSGETDESETPRQNCDSSKYFSNIKSEPETLISVSVSFDDSENDIGCTAEDFDEVNLRSNSELVNSSQAILGSLLCEKKPGIPSSSTPHSIRRKPFRGWKSSGKVQSNKKIQWQVKHLDILNGAAPIKCCEVRFETDEDFQSHVNTEHKSDSLKSEKKCEFCGRNVLEKYKDFHVSILHDPNLSKLDCHLCDEKFWTKKCLNRHKRKTHRIDSARVVDGKIFCEECKKYYTLDFYRRYHLPVVHKKDNRTFQCEFCGKNMKSESYLKHHVSLYHSGNKAKCCEKCGKVFQNRESLSKHKRIHEADLITDKDQFKCTQCGITLKHSASLKKHIYLMHGKAAGKTFSCELCGKTTKNMTNMRIHMKVHDPSRFIKHNKKYQGVEAPKNQTNPQCVPESESKI